MHLFFGIPVDWVVDVSSICAGTADLLESLWVLLEVILTIDD